MTLDGLRRGLRERLPLRDEDFDAIYPLVYQRASARYWTPVDTARRATDLLVGEGARRILDVGAGVGKFCLVGAASTTRASFVGIEQRAHLVEAACEAKRRLRSERVEIVHGSLENIEATAFDALYFYNPFAENLFGPTSRLDDRTELSPERYEDDVRLAGTILAAAPAGTCVVTYYGYGGRMPSRYDLVHTEWHGCGALELWIQGAARRGSRDDAP